MPDNTSLRGAKNRRDDEFYTRYEDVDAELSLYKRDLHGRSVYCGADGPDSAFVRWLLDHWAELGLKHLTATRYNPWGPLFAHGDRWDWDAPGEPRHSELEGDGDMFSDECRAILAEHDVFITNPPFSLMRRLIPMLDRSGKRYLVLLPPSALKYSTIFPLVLSARAWVGGHWWAAMFDRPDGSRSRVTVTWLTNMPGVLSHRRPFTPGDGDPTAGIPFDGHPDVIDYDRLEDVPRDLTGMAGVPITVLAALHPGDPHWRVVGKFDTDTGWDTPVVKGRELFTRVLIERRPWVIGSSNTPSGPAHPPERPTRGCAAAHPGR